MHRLPSFPSSGLAGLPPFDTASAILEPNNKLSHWREGNSSSDLLPGANRASLPDSG